MDQNLSRTGGYLSFAYSVLCYVTFLAVFVYFILFAVGLFVPKTVNDGPSLSIVAALLVDVALLLLFAVQHSVMARPSFKERWTRLVPPAVERSTFVLVASVCLASLVAGWAPIEGELWRTDHDVAVVLLWGLCAGGWSLLLLSTFLIDHFELFGLKQGWLRARRAESKKTAFKTPALYRMVRHPMMLGFLLGFWATPHMTASRFVLAMGMTLYILVGIAFEERDLVRHFGEHYRRYQRTVPMLIPRLRPRVEAATTAPRAELER